MRKGRQESFRLRSCCTTTAIETHQRHNPRHSPHQHDQNSQHDEPPRRDSIKSAEMVPRQDAANVKKDGRIEQRINDVLKAVFFSPNTEPGGA